MRVFEHGDLIPDEVDRVSSPDGDVYVRHCNGYFKMEKDPDGLSGYLSANTSKSGKFEDDWFEFEFPLTEVQAERQLGAR